MTQTQKASATLAGEGGLSVYDVDILTWSEQQADLLRRLAAGERVNDQVDWENVIGEVQDVGISILKSCRSQLRIAILHRLKAMAWPDTAYVAHWESEATAASNNAEDDFVESMRAKIDVAELYAKARRAMPRTIDGVPPGPVPAECPWTLNELLAGDG